MGVDFGDGLLEFVMFILKFDKFDRGGIGKDKFIPKQSDINLLGFVKFCRFFNDVYGVFYNFMMFMEFCGVL